MVHRVTHGTHSYSVSQGLPYIFHRSEVLPISDINSNHSAALPPMTGFTLMCLSIVLLVHKFHYWLAGSKETMYVSKPSLLYTRNKPSVKTLVLCVKEKWLHHKHISCRVFNMVDYLKLLPIGGWWTVIRPRYLTVYLLVLQVDICMYIYLNTKVLCNRLVLWFWREIIWSWPSQFCLTIWFYFLERNYFVMMLIILSIFF